MKKKQRIKLTKTQELIYAGKLCPYCSRKTVYVDSAEVYGRSFGMIYLCRPCRAWVGVHDGTNNALGRIANDELREWKKQAHYYFDKLWRAKIAQGLTKGHARGKAYKWLASQLGITGQETHIGWFDVDKCKKVVEVCKPHVERLKL
jgi:hypothetical protein